MRHETSSTSARGFTLIEVLVSLLILAVLATTAWKGMDAISMARQITADNLKRTLRLQSVMTQFEADMGQIMDTMVVPGMQYDGAHLRFTRKLAEGMAVVVWYQQQGKLIRWVSPVTSKVGELQKYWLSSYQLQGGEPGTLVTLEGVENWGVFCYRNGTLSNCQSTGDVATRSVVSTSQSATTGASTQSQAAAAAAATAMANREQLPNAIRCKLKLGEGSGFSGTLTRDVVIAPQMNQV